MDDDAVARRLLVTMMVGEGFTCAAAETLAQARARTVSFDPELILLDVNLAGESGLTLADELRIRAGGPAVLIVSADDDAEVAKRALDAGALGYVTKPFTRTDLTIAVDAALRRRSESQSAILRLRHANEETVRRLSKAVEFRDPETGAHIERMSHYCALLATHFDLEPELIRVASGLHDVGKIATPDSILLKPGPLTVSERAVMETHAQIGYELLEGSGIQLLDQAAVIAWSHHERYDGTGYPRALAGEDIPLSGRIAGVADVFDALTTQRVYRSPLSVDQAVAVLRDERGRHFDPVVVDAFLSDLEAVEAIMTRFGVAATGHTATTSELVSLQVAAASLGITVSRLRRWADSGRVKIVRTAGGHRRFPVTEVRRLASERATPPAVRPLDPPSDPLRGLAHVLEQHGRRLADIAAAALYNGDPEGWFGAAPADQDRTEWLTALARGCRSGDYAEAFRASEVFLQRAYLRGTGLLERLRFIEHLSRLAVQALTKLGASGDEIVGTRRLFAALGEAHLDERE
ncbi:response regulator [Solirubrobacter phytolaccae]|uniref:Response regulator n=1 Tax=Solirubrobacter phytolaccae TaxID=1404360 RepID=A0A9X3SEN8_9ACTN|nr:HD domain-containing phosphohydrolase [Solirubrobacter phytolaccae]MDA0180572.1 response regulator [Solirubrobacter phytolaccae]